MRPTPAHALTREEREQIVSVANEPRFADLPPARIVPMLAYYMSVSNELQRQPLEDSKLGIGPV